MRFLLWAITRNKKEHTCHQLPGPRGIPILGNALSLRFDRLELSLFRLAHQYGKILQINILGQSCIVLNDVEIIRKALLDETYRDVFSDRADHFTGKYIMFDHGDIIFGKASKTTFALRKILSKCIKRFGEDEQQEYDEIHDDISQLEQSEGTDVDIVHFVMESAGSGLPV